MKKVTKRTIAAVLALLAVIAAFSGCKKAEEEQETDTPGASGSPVAAESVYVPSYVSLPKEIMNMYASALVGDKIYFMNQVPVAPDGTVIPQEEIDAYYAEFDSYQAEVASGVEPTGEMPFLEFEYLEYLYSVNADGTNLQRAEAFVPTPPPEGDGYVNYQGMKADPQGNIWLMETMTVQQFDLPEDFDPLAGNKWDYMTGETNTYTVRKLDPTGNELSRVVLNDFVDMSLAGDYFYIQDFAVDGEGNLYFDDSSGTSVVIIGADGTLMSKAPYANYMSGFVPLADGTVMAALPSDTGGMDFTVIDPATGGFGKKYPSASFAYSYMPGNDEFDFCYSDSSSLTGYDLETATETRILDWINCDIDGGSIQLCALRENGEVFVVSNYYNPTAGSNLEVATLVKTPVDQAVVKETLTLATMSLDWNLRSTVLNFNKTNPKYRIDVKDYSQYNTAEDYSAGLTKLNTEIITGNIPDMITTRELPYKQYSAKGLLEDLYPYIENDAEINMDDLVENVFSALANDGKLFSVSSSFSIVSVMGRPDLLGPEPSWTMEELMALCKAHPEADAPLGGGASRDDIFNAFAMLNMDNFVNWNTGECSFDTAEFKSLLEFANIFPTMEDISSADLYVSDSELIAQGRALAALTTLGDFMNYQYYKAMFGGDVVFKSLPGTQSGNVAVLEGGIAMTSACKNKEAAWEFMRITISEDFQRENVWSFPTNKNVFDEKLKEAMKQEYDAEGRPISTGGISDGVIDVDIYAVSQQEADQIMGLVNSVSRVADYDMSLSQMVLDEARAYFNGEKSVDETAALIQSRMNIYINEQR